MISADGLRVAVGILYVMGANQLGMFSPGGELHRPGVFLDGDGGRGAHFRPRHSNGRCLRPARRAIAGGVFPADSAGAIGPAWSSRFLIPSSTAARPLLKAQTCGAFSRR